MIRISDGSRRPFRTFICVVVVLILGIGSIAAASPLPAKSPADLPPTVARPDTIAFGAGTSYMIGRSLLDRGDRKAALPYLGQAYHLCPDELEIGWAFLDALLGEGYLDKALEVNRHMLQIEPGDYRLTEQLILMLTGTGQYDEALGLVAEMQAAHPDSTDPVLLEGEVLSRSGRPEEALERYRYILPLRPDRAVAIYAAMAEIHQKTGDDQALAALWREALAAVPESSALRLGALKFLVGAERYAEAAEVAAAGDAIEGEGDSAPTVEGDRPWLEMLAELLISSRRLAEARELLAPAFGAGALSLDSSIMLGRLMAQADDLPAATLHMRRVVELWPDSARAHLYLGEFLADGGDLSAGETELRTARQLDERDSEAMMALITLLATRYPEALSPAPPTGATLERRLEIGRLAEAASTLVGFDSPRNSMLLGITLQGVGNLALAARHYEAAARSPDYRRDALLNLSLVEEQLRHPDRVLMILEELLQDYPDDPVVCNGLGYSLADQGIQLRKAESLIRSALAKDPDNPAYLDSLGWVLYRQEDHAGALDYMIRAANALPDDPTILEHLGFVLEANGQPDRALRAFIRALQAGSVNPEVPARIEALGGEVVR